MTGWRWQPFLSSRITAFLLLLVFLVATDGITYLHFSDLARGTVRLARLVTSAAGKDAADDLFRPRGGEQVLPAQVRDMLALLRRQDIRTFAISPAIVAEGEISQRITEGAIPRLLDSQSDNLLMLSSETLPKDCRAVAVEHEVVLARCS